MNSKQRRIFNRKWRYKVTIGADQVSLKKINEIENWCYAKYGKKGFQSGPILLYQYVNFYFDKLEKLTEFNIVWWETINAKSYDE